VVAVKNAALDPETLVRVEAHRYGAGGEKHLKLSKSLPSIFTMLPKNLKRMKKQDQSNTFTSSWELTTFGTLSTMKR
jgi:hypothetical protein